MPHAPVGYAFTFGLYAGISSEGPADRSQLSSKEQLMDQTCSKTVKVYVAEEQEVYREVYKSVFSASRQGSPIDLLGTSANGDKGALMDALTRLSPDVLLMGTKRIGSDVIEELEQVRAEFPSMGLVLLLGLCNAENIKQLRTLALKGGGGMALFFKHSLDQIEQLRGAVLAVSQGQVILAPELAAILFTENNSYHFLRQLTARESEILGLLSQGHTNAAIADVLCIDIKTVSHHINNMYSKLKADVSFDDKHPRVSVARFYLEAAGELFSPNMLVGKQVPVYAGN